VEKISTRDFKVMTGISVVIVTRNRSRLLKKCLTSLKAKLGKDPEIIVVDNASSDSTLNTLRDFNKIKLIINPKNLGVAAARNQGTKASSGKFVVFLDDDAYFTNTTSLSKIITYMNKNKKVSLVGPRILYPNGHIQESARSFPVPLAVLWRGTTLSKLFPNVSFYQKYLLDNSNYTKPALVDWVIGACQVVRRSAFNKVGLLDESFFFGYEDIDFCFRLQKKGHKVIYFPEVGVVHHYQRASSRGLISWAKIEHAKSIAKFFKRVYFPKQ